MRMNGIPRSIAERMGENYQASPATAGGSSGIQKVRQFLASADIQIWNRSRPANTPQSGREYKESGRSFLEKGADPQRRNDRQALSAP